MQDKLWGLLTFYEWDRFGIENYSSTDITIDLEKSKDLNNYPMLKSIKDIEIRRNDSSLNLDGKLILCLRNSTELIRYLNNGIAKYDRGKEIVPITLYFKDKSNYLINNLKLIFHISKSEIEKNGANSFIFDSNKIVVHIEVVSFESTIMGFEVFYLKEFYCNAPNIGFANGSRDQRLKVEYHEGRKASNLKYDINININNCQNFSNYISYKWKETTIDVFKPSCNCNNHKDCITIEYRGSIPKIEERSKIVDFISFIHGRHLIKCGETAFNFNHAPLKYTSLTPFRYEIQKLQNTFSIIEIYPNNSSETFDKCFDSFYDKYEKYNLDTFFSVYWRALSSEIDLALLQFQQAFECLIDSHYKIEGNSPSVMDGKTFQKLCEPELKSIEEKLLNQSGKDAIVNKIKQAYEKSETKKRKEFLESISVEITSEREEAFNDCMKIKHGNFGLISTEEMISDYLIYITYLNEIILKLIGYDGKIKDYYKEIRFYKK